MEKKNSELFSNPERIENVLKDSKVEELTGQKNKLLSELTDVKKQLKDTEANYDDEQKKHDQKKAEFDKLQERFDSVEKENQTNKEEFEKSIKELEDEVEDLEDDLKDTKKDLNQKKEEFTELNKKYDSVEKENQTNKENLKKANETIKEQEKKLSVKDGSLSFVREILKAKEVNSGNIQDIYSKIDSAADYISEDFKDCIDNIANLKNYCCNDAYYKNLFENDLPHWKITSKKTWIKDKTTVAFVGEFSAGKTSIVNKILTQGGSSITLPVSTKATTAIPTYISGNDYAIKAQCKFFTPDNKTKNLTEKTFNEVNKETLHEVDGVSNLIKYFIMTVKNENLKNFSILDTPGFSSNDKEDAQRTIDVINECDALFWIFDVNNGNVNNTSLKIIKKYLKKPLFVVINKTDTKAHSEVAKVEDLIKTTFNREGIKVEKYIRFSQKENVSTIFSVIRSVRKTNNTSYFLENLRNYADRLCLFLESKVNNLEKQKVDLVKEVSTHSDSIKSCTEHIIHNLKEIKDQYYLNINAPIKRTEREKFFGGVKYKFTEDTYNQLKQNIESCEKLLTPDKIGLPKLKAANENYTKAYAEYEDFLRKYSDAKAERDRFEECVKRLKEKLNAVK